MRSCWRQFKQVVKFLLFPWPVLTFFRNSGGGVGIFCKLGLLRAALRNASQSGSESTFAEQLTLVGGILNIPEELQGVVAEFGCYKGAATATLSLACAATGRKLVVLDSFEGLPEPTEQVTSIATGTPIPYKAGDLCGTLDEVKKRVARFGSIDVCEFVQGFFEQTLAARDASERFVLIFEDADLPQSVRSVLTHCWPKLQDGCHYYCHEARDKQVVDLFYETALWQEELRSEMPGFCGSGCGLPLNPSGSMLGYAVKRKLFSEGI
jgi:hypothetical protein